MLADSGNCKRRNIRLSVKASFRKYRFRNKTNRQTKILTGKSDSSSADKHSINSVIEALKGKEY